MQSKAKQKLYCAEIFFNVSPPKIERWEYSSLFEFVYKNIDFSTFTISKKQITQAIDDKIIEEPRELRGESLRIWVDGDMINIKYQNNYDNYFIDKIPLSDINQDFTKISYGFAAKYQGGDTDTDYNYELIFVARNNDLGDEFLENEKRNYAYKISSMQKSQDEIVRLFGGTKYIDYDFGIRDEICFASSKKDLEESIISKTDLNT